MFPLITICVPVYNVEPYIERCVRSLMEQTYDNLEFVFVDDCSTDKSIDVLRAIIDLYPNRKPYVRIIRNDRNHGIAYTRNVSFENATGQYLCCVDSDDYVDLDMVDSLYAQMQKHDADVICGSNYVHIRGKQLVEQPLPEYESYDAVSFPLRGVFCSMCGVLCKRELFTPDVLPPEGLDYLEDRLCRLKLALKGYKTVFVNDITYHYVMNDKSITSSVSEKNMQCFVQFWQIAVKLLQDYNLTDKYKDLVAYAKVQNKTSLMLHTGSMEIRKRYANLFYDEESEVMHTLTRGFWIMSHLIHYHLWPLIWVYQCYIELKKVKFHVNN